MTDKKVPGSFAEAEKEREKELNIDDVATAKSKTVDLAEFNKIAEELEKYKAKADDHWERLLRKEAELRNAESRAQAAISRERKFALEKIFKEMTVVLDSLDGGIESINAAEDVESAKEGMQLIHTLFIDTLGKFGLEVLSPLGDKFDPTMHEAMTMVESGEHEPNSIMQVVQKGYVLNGRVIRPARVIVAKA